MFDIIKGWIKRNWLLLFSGVATIAVFGAAFALSFAQLADLAAMFGMGKWAWLWPFCLDTLATVSAIAVLYARWEGTEEDTRFPRIVMLIATAFSITFNAFHAAGSAEGIPMGRLFVLLERVPNINLPVIQQITNVLIAWVMGALAPAAACTLLEVLLRLIGIYRRSALQETKRVVVKEGQTLASTSSLDKDARQLTMLEEWSRDGTLPRSHFAELFGVTESTITRYKREMRDDGRIKTSTNGEGGELVEVVRFYPGEEE